MDVRLNPDCVRDVMIFIEENLEYGGLIDQFKIVNGLSDKYSEVDLLYSTEQLIMRGWLIAVNTSGIIIGGIHPNGHDFLANTRAQGIWGKVRSKLKEKGIEAAIEIMGKLAWKITEAELGL